MLKETEFRLNDNVIARIVQIIQEGFLTGTDVSDHMRQIRMCQGESNNEFTSLVLTPEYKKQVEVNIQKMVDFVEEKQNERRLLTEDQIADKATD